MVGTLIRPDELPDPAAGCGAVDRTGTSVGGAMHKGKTLFLFSFLVVPVLIFALFVISPFLQIFYLALTDWTGYTPNYNFVGLQNFQSLFSQAGVLDREFWAGLRNNLILLVVVPAITLTIALFFATMLNLAGSTRAGQLKGVSGAGFYRLLFFLPQLFSVAALAIMFQQTFQPNGLLNWLVRLITFSPPGPNEAAGQAWLAQPWTALGVVIFLLVWMNVGFYMVHFTAAMAAIPRELLEAAAIDKASKVQTFFRVTLPLLWPAVQTALVYLMIMCLDVLAIVNLMTIGPGGPDNATTVMALSVFKAKTQGLFGFSSAEGVIVFAVTAIVAAVMLRITRREQVEL